MKILTLRALVVISLVALTLTAIAVPTTYRQGFTQIDMYVMPEPFSASPLITYSSMESSPGES